MTAGSSGSSPRSRRRARRAVTPGANVADVFRAGGDTWITGSYDPDLDTTYWGVAQAKPWVPASRGNSALDRALYTSTTLALNPNDGSLKWYYQHAPGEALDLDEVYERVLIDVGGEKALFTIGKPGILWKLDRESGRFIDHKETIFQNVFDRIDPETGRAALPRRHRGRQGRRMGAGVPEHRRRAQLAGDDAPCADVAPDHSLEPKLHRDSRPASRARRGRRQLGRRPALLRDAGHGRQHRQARGLRHANAGGAVVARAARAVPDGRALDARRRRVRRRSRSQVQGRRRRDGRGAVGEAAHDLGARVSRSRSAPAAGNTSP